MKKKIVAVGIAGLILLGIAIGVSKAVNINHTKTNDAVIISGVKFTKVSDNEYVAVIKFNRTLKIGHEHPYRDLYYHLANVELNRTTLSKVLQTAKKTGNIYYYYGIIYTKVYKTQHNYTEIAWVDTNYNPKIISKTNNTIEIILEVASKK